MEEEESYEMEGAEQTPDSMGRSPGQGRLLRGEYFGEVSACGTEAGNQVGLEGRKG